MRYLIWDFDGTLGYREEGWTGAMLEVARHELSNLAFSAAELRPYLQTGFPWHDPDIAREGLTATEWWDALDSVFERAFVAVGLDRATARRLAHGVRRRYPSPERWRLYDDTIPALQELAADGWRHVILSNHVPELATIVRGLAIDHLFERLFNSAETGYEKPHPRAFHCVLEALGPDAHACMIGDNMVADIWGAQAVGLRAILVRKRHPDALHGCDRLDGLASLLDAMAD